MPNLKVLEASLNHFTEPQFDAVPCTMQALNLFKNNLTGDLQRLGKGAMELRWLDIQYNNLSGPLPEDLPSNLGILKISNNTFTGTLPSSWSKLPMADLRLDKNQVTGKLPPSWSAWGSSTGNSLRLSIQDTRLHGGMPKEWVQQFCLAIFRYSEAQVLFRPPELSLPRLPVMPTPMVVEFGDAIQLPAQQASINVTLAGKNHTFDYNNPDSVCGIPEAGRITGMVWGIFSAALLVALVGIVMWQRRKAGSQGCIFSHWGISTVIMHAHNRLGFMKQAANRLWFLVSDVGWTMYSPVTDAITIHQVYSSGQLRYARGLLAILLIPFAIVVILISRVSIKVCQGKVGSGTLIRRAAAAVIGLLLAPVLFLAIEFALIFHGVGGPLPAFWGSLDIDLETFYHTQSVAEAFFSALPQSFLQSRLYLMAMIQMASVYTSTRTCLSFLLPHFFRS